MSVTCSIASSNQHERESAHAAMLARQNPSPPMFSVWYLAITFITASDWADAFGWETSTTCTSSCASAISSSVALNAAISCVGSFWMKPTVSVSKTCKISPQTQCVMQSWMASIRHKHSQLCLRKNWEELGRKAVACPCKTGIGIVA